MTPAIPFHISVIALVCILAALVVLAQSDELLKKYSKEYVHMAFVILMSQGMGALISVVFDLYQIQAAVK